MALNSEELLANDDIEGIFAITDSDILTEPKDLETKFAVAFSKKEGDLFTDLFFISKLQKNI